MKPQLLILKKKDISSTRTTVNYFFVVVDSELNLPYPRNFVCQLPQLGKYKEDETEFSKIFGKQSLDLASNLLLTALQSERDPIARRMISKRVGFLANLSNGTRAQS